MKICITRLLFVALTLFAVFGVIERATAQTTQITTSSFQLLSGETARNKQIVLPVSLPVAQESAGKVKLPDNALPSRRSYERPPTHAPPEQRTAQPVRVFTQGPAAATSPCSSSSPDSWSPSYFFGAGGGSPYVSITGGGLTSQVAAAGSNHQVTEIGQCLHSTGQLYIELTTITVNGSDLGFGFSAVTKDNQRTLGALQLVGATPDSVGYQFFGSSRKWQYNNTFGSLVNLPLPANGNVIGLAVDFNNKRLWIRNSTVSCSTWYGSNTSSADPSTGTNGFDFSSPAPAGLPWAVAWASNFNGGTTEGATMNPAGPFLCPAPTPFNPWQSASIKFNRYYAAESANDNFIQREFKIAA